MQLIRSFVLLVALNISLYCSAQQKDASILEYNIKNDIIGKADFFTTDNLGQVYLISEHLTKMYSSIF